MIVTQDHKKRIFVVLFYVAIIFSFTFTDITDIYACIVNLVEHSYGYDSTEILLTDTQVVHLMASLEEGDYDTDQDNLLDRQELDHEENVNISNLLEEYINYNRLPEEEANKLRADPYIKMWAYKSNPALPDTDFDGRNDDFDIYRIIYTSDDVE